MTTAEMKEQQDELNPKKRGLGRGLNALFEDDEAPFVPGMDEFSDGSQGSDKTSRRILGIDQLASGPFQPRQHMDDSALKELSESIALHGVLQPILVRPNPEEDGKFQIIAGERRWRAAQKAQLHEVPVIVKDLEETTAYEIALIENLQREDLNSIEEAQGFQRLQNEFSYTQEKLAEVLGKSRSHIANMLRLLNLPENVQELVRDGQLSAGHGRALVTVSDPLTLAEMIIKQGLSVRDAEKMAGGAGTKKKSVQTGKTAQSNQKDVDTLALEQEISSILGMNVTIDLGGPGNGSLKIDYKSLDQLDDIIHRLSHNPEYRTK